MQNSKWNFDERNTQEAKNVASRNVEQLYDTTWDLPGKVMKSECEIRVQNGTVRMGVDKRF